MKKNILVFVVIAVNNVETTGELTIDTYVYENECEALGKKADLIRERLANVDEDYWENSLTDHNIEENRRSCLYNSECRFDVQVQERQIEVADDSEDIYTPIGFPDIQSFMDLEGFKEHSYLINDEQGMEDFGSSAYMVEKAWLNSL